MAEESSSQSNVEQSSKKPEQGRRNIIHVIRDWPLSRKISLAAVGAICIILFALLIFQAQKIEYRTLYANLPTKEASSVVTWLKEHNVPYELRNNGKSIYVPGNKVYETRLNLAGAGLPKGGGVGFEVFDKQNFGVTEFTQKVNYQRALQGELARTVTALKPVKSSRVHLVLPEKRLLKEQQKPAKASVVVDLASGRSLDQGQIQGIVHLVSGSIQGLEKDQVTIIDGSGNILNKNSGRLVDGDLGPERLKYINTLESRLEERAQSMLDAALGPGNSVVRVTAQLDFSRKTSTEELYDPDVLVPRSEKSTEKSSGAAASGGIPGTESNLRDGSESTSETASSSSTETVNYEINKTVNRIQDSVGDIERLSVAVLIKEKFVPGGEGEEGTYQARDQEKLNSFKAMVSSALGLKSSRGDTIEVVSMPFNRAQVKGTKVSTQEAGYYKFLPYLKYFFIITGLVLLYFLLIRPVIRTLKGESVQYPMTVRELEEGYGQESEPGQKELEPTAQLKKQIEQEIADKSTTPAQVIRVWLKEG